MQSRFPAPSSRKSWRHSLFEKQFNIPPLSVQDSCDSIPQRTEAALKVKGGPSPNSVLNFHTVDCVGFHNFFHVHVGRENQQHVSRWLFCYQTSGNTADLHS